MMSNEGYRDRILTCRDCGNDFTFTVGEQEFYANKGLTNTPSRCPSCRALRRGGQSNSGSRAPRGEQYDAICATCGRPTSVPFIPREDRPVYCSDCFQAQRASRPPRRDDSNSYSGGSYGGGNAGGGSYGGGNAGGGGRGRDRDRRDGGRDRRDSRW
jgi:CxxC-x17-CxxC domain-containing protein